MVRSSFLCNGITLATFNLSGKIPVTRDWLIMSVIDGNMGECIVLSNLTESVSPPIDD